MACQRLVKTCPDETRRIARRWISSDRKRSKKGWTYATELHVVRTAGVIADAGINKATSGQVHIRRLGDYGLRANQTMETAEGYRSVGSQGDSPVTDGDAAEAAKNADLNAIRKVWCITG